MLMPWAAHSFWCTNSHLARPTFGHSCLQTQSTRRFPSLLTFSRKTTTLQNLGLPQSQPHKFSRSWALHSTKLIYWTLFWTSFIKIWPLQPEICPFMCLKFINLLYHEISRFSPTDSKVLLYETRLRLNCLYKPLKLIFPHWWGEHPSGCEPPAGPPRWAQHARSCHFFKKLFNFTILHEINFCMSDFQCWCLGLRTASGARILT